MEVIAREKGFYAGRPIGAGEKFEVPSGAKAAWYTPVDAVPKPQAEAAPAKEAPNALSKVGTAKAKSFNEAMKPDLA